MNCPKCGTILHANAKFCKRCGANVTTSCRYEDNIANSVYDSKSCHTEQYNYSYNYSNKSKPNYNINASHSDQYDYNYLYSKFNYIPTTTVGDERYIESYIGQNYSLIKTTKFSIGTFFFGGYHLLYRKLYYYAFIYFLLTISASLLISDYATIVHIIVRMFMSIKFNELYLAHAERKVEQIKQGNLDKTSTELLDECRKRGGVSLKSAILIPIITIVLLSIGLIYLVETNNTSFLDKLFEKTDIEEIQKNTYNTPTINQDTSANMITYIIPENTKLLSKSPTTLVYIYQPSDAKTACYIKITAETNNSTSPTENLTNKINSSIGMQSNAIAQITKNNHIWYYTHLESQTKSQTYYSINYNNSLYTIETYNYVPNEVNCNEIYSTFIDSINFKN